MIHKLHYTEESPGKPVEQIKDHFQESTFSRRTLGDFDADRAWLTLWKAIHQDTESKEEKQNCGQRENKGAKCEKLNNNRRFM